MKSKKAKGIKTKRTTIMLIIWLSALLIYNIFALINNLSFVVSTDRIVPSLYWIIGLVETIFIIFMYRLRKWAFFGICITTLILSVINLVKGWMIEVVIAFGWLTVLYLILRPQWELLK